MLINKKNSRKLQQNRLMLKLDRLNKVVDHKQLNLIRIFKIKVCILEDQ